MPGLPSSRNHFPFRVFALSILIILTLPVLIQDGMFMDGMLYTSVAHNMSIGYGTFWYPQFSLHNIAGMTSFHEQPPLVFGIESFFFRILGSSMYVERLYIFLTLLITAFLINSFWKKIFIHDNELSKTGWLPVILWITIPVCYWSYSNNMMENTMGIFTLIAGMICYQGLTSERKQNSYFLLSGLFVFLASFSKGFPGFFPLTIPFLHWLILRRISFQQMVKYSLLILSVSVLVYTILFLVPESRESLDMYLFKRAFHRMQDVPTVDNRFYILYKLMMELVPQIILIGIIFFVGRRKKNQSQPGLYKEAIFFLATGLSATLPIMLTLVQKRFYFVPALPFFAIGLAMLIAPHVSGWMKQLEGKAKTIRVLRLISFVVLLGVLIFSFSKIGKTSRERDTLHDVYLIGSNVPDFSVINIPVEMWNDWSLQCYLSRYFQISLSTDGSYNYFLVTKPGVPGPGYTRYELPTMKYDLYRKTELK